MLVVRRTRKISSDWRGFPKTIEMYYSINRRLVNKDLTFQMPDLVGTQHFCSESVFKIQNLHFLTNYYNISKY